MRDNLVNRHGAIVRADQDDYGIGYLNPAFDERTVGSEIGNFSLPSILLYY